MKTKILYHIGPRPASPKPAVPTPHTVRGVDSEGWSRPWLKAPVKSGVFLTANPLQVALNHGVYGHVYAYRVPISLIKKAGGLHKLDKASEILISEELWNEYNADINFLGKSLSVDDLVQRYRDYRGYDYIRDPDQYNTNISKKSNDYYDKILKDRKRPQTNESANCTLLEYFGVSAVKQSSTIEIKLKRLQSLIRESLLRE